MGKKHDIEELTNLIAISLRHRIGSIVNKEEIYASKYAKDAETIMKQADEIATQRTWDIEDKEIIKNKVKYKLRKELEKADFLNQEKFDIMDREINIALRKLNLL